MISILVDDGHQPQTVQRHRATPGRKPALRVRETVAILLAMDRVPLPSERGFLAFLRVNHPTLFPQLPALSHVNRHARAVRGMVEHIRQSWFKNWAVADERQRIRDTKPVPVVGYKRTQTRSDCAGSATYGYCASRNMVLPSFWCKKQRILTGYVRFTFCPSLCGETARVSPRCCRYRCRSCHHQRPRFARHTVETSLLSALSAAVRTDP